MLSPKRPYPFISAVPESTKKTQAPFRSFCFDSTTTTTTTTTTRTPIITTTTTTTTTTSSLIKNNPRNLKNLSVTVAPERTAVSAPSTPTTQDIPTALENSVPMTAFPHQLKPSSGLLQRRGRAPSVPLILQQSKCSSETMPPPTPAFGKKSLQNPPATASLLPPSSFSEYQETTSLKDDPYKHEPICIMPNLYLGSEQNASNKDVLTKMNVEYILNVAKEVKNPFENNHSVWSEQNEIRMDEDELATRAPALSPSSSTSSSSSLQSDSASQSSGGCDLIVVDGQNNHGVFGSRRDSDSSVKRNLSKHAPSFQFDVSPPSPAHTSVPRTIQYKKFSWQHNQQNLTDDFNSAFDYIEKARSAGRSILVHCQLGVSRSASLVIAYVMKSQKMTLDKAYEFVKQRSPSISPNMSLVYQLKEFEERLGLSQVDESSRFPPESPRGRTVGGHYQRNSSVDKNENNEWDRELGVVKQKTSLLKISHNDSPVNNTKNPAPLTLQKPADPPKKPAALQLSLLSRANSEKFSSLSLSSPSTPSTPSLRLSPVLTPYSRSPSRSLSRSRSRSPSRSPSPSRCYRKPLVLRRQLSTASLVAQLSPATLTPPPFFLAGKSEVNPASMEDVRLESEIFSPTRAVLVDGFGGGWGDV